MTALTAPQPLRAPGFGRLVLLHTRFGILETVRIPIAVIGNLLFPGLALVFFVVPNAQVADDPVAATSAVAQLALFAVMSTFLFTFGAGVAEDRALPFDGYLRTLPAGVAPRLLARVLTGLLFALASLVPLLLLGALLTAATVDAGTLGLGVLVVLAAALPFLMLGLAIGYRLSNKAAIAVVQLLLFPLAFAGGLFLPPQLFPGWLESVSQWLPSRAGRDVVVETVTGVESYPLALPVLLGWALLCTVLAGLAHRHDEGSRFR